MTPGTARTRDAAGPPSPEVGSDAGTLLAQIERFRRRTRVAIAFRHTWVALTLGLIGAQFVVLIRGSAGSALEAAAVVVVALGVAVVSAFLRTPSLSGTATALDARAGLEDRIRTALQFVHQDDPVARLIRRDAEARLADLVPRRVFPLDAPRFVRAWLALLAVTTTGFLLVTEGGAGRWVMDRGDGWLISGGPAGPETPSPAADDSVPGSQAAEPNPAATEMERALATAPEDASTPVTSSADAPQADTAGEAGNEADDTTAGAGSAPADAAREDDGSRTAAGREAAAGDASKAAGAPGEAASEPSGGGGRGATTTGEAAGAGGVRDGGLSEPSRQPAPAPAGPAYAASARAAQARAEAAVAQERVPPRWRNYVRAYFNSIRPEGRQ